MKGKIDATQGEQGRISEGGGILDWQEGEDAPDPRERRCLNIDGEGKQNGGKKDILAGEGKGKALTERRGRGRLFSKGGEMAA